MFTADATIDAIQNGKKTFVKLFVQNETMADTMNSFIDEQSAYTKKAIGATTEMFTTVAQETIKTAQNATKFDYAKFGEGVMKAYTATVSSKK
jgi:hypothetical protein